MNAFSRRQLIVLIYILAFVSAIGNPIVLPILPFIMQDFALTPLEMGMVISIYALPGVIIIPLYGVLSDRLGRRPLLLTALFLCSAGSLICWGAPNFFWLLAGRALQGLSITPLEAMGNTLGSDLFSGEDRMRFITKVTAVQYFSIAITPLIVSFLLSIGGWRMSFFYAVLLGGVSLILALPIKVPYQPSKGISLHEYSRHLRILLSSPRALSLFSVRMGSALIIFGAIYPHLSLFVEKILRTAPEDTAILFTLYAVGMFLGAMLAQWCMKHFSPRTTGFFGGMMLVASMLLLLFGSLFWYAAPALLLVGTGTGIINTCCTAHVSLVSTPDTRGSIMSAYSTIFRLGQAAAPLLFSFFYQIGSFDAVFGMGLMFAIALTTVAVVSFSYAAKLEHVHNDLHS
ncbi:MAG: MFS transporter [Mailhella sp.]